MVGESERAQRFAFALQQAMAARKVSARQLAGGIGVDARIIGRWRKAKALPDLYQTGDLVRILRVKEELFKDPPPVPVMPAYPINEYLLGAAEALVSDAVAEGQAEGRRVARRPPAGEAPSVPEQLPPRRSAVERSGSR